MAPKRRKKAPAVGEGAVFNQSTGEMSVELCFCRAMCAVSQPATDRSTSSLHADTYVDLAALCAGEVSELQIKSVIQLLHRALARTETGGRNNCLGFAMCGELHRITTYHNIAWPGNFPRDGNDVRSYLWDHMREYTRVLSP